MVGIGRRGSNLAWLAALGCMSLGAQTTLSLEQAGARNPSANFSPTHLNERVIVQGVVNSRAYHFPNYTLLAIDDGSFGAVLKVDGADTRLDAYRPGDDLQVNGTVAAFVGMVVVQPAGISKLGVKPAPKPVEVPLNDLIAFRHLGRLVRTQARMHAVGDT